MAHILIVDDNEVDRLIGRAMLEAAGHDIYYAQDGEIALRIFESREVDVVVTDLAMPNLNGHRLIEAIMSQRTDIPIIAVSGVSAEQLDYAQLAGASATLCKPYSPRDFLDTIERVLGGAVSPPPNDLWGR